MACKDNHDGTGTLESAVIKEAAQDIAYDSDEFRLFVAKIAICPRKAIHVWSECPYVHPGEKARRRDPRLHHYSSQPCPDNSLALQKGGVCPRGDACHYSHNLFETHLHPEMYRTAMCTAGARCRRRLCFFAHNPQELRQPTTVQMAAQEQQQQQHAAAADAPDASESSTAAAAVEQVDSACAGSPTAGRACASCTAVGSAAHRLSCEQGAEQQQQQQPEKEQREPLQRDDSMDLSHLMRLQSLLSAAESAAEPQDMHDTQQQQQQQGRSLDTFALLDVLPGLLQEAHISRQQAAAARSDASSCFAQLQAATALAAADSSGSRGQVDRSSSSSTTAAAATWLGNSSRAMEQQQGSQWLASAEQSALQLHRQSSINHTLTQQGLRRQASVEQSQSQHGRHDAASLSPAAAGLQLQCDGPIASQGLASPLQKQQQQQLLLADGLRKAAYAAAAKATAEGDSYPSAALAAAAAAGDDVRSRSRNSNSSSSRRHGQQQLPAAYTAAAAAGRSPLLTLDHSAAGAAAGASAAAAAAAGEQLTGSSQWGLLDPIMQLQDVLNSYAVQQQAESAAATAAAAAAASDTTRYRQLLLLQQQQQQLERLRFNNAASAHPPAMQLPLLPGFPASSSSSTLPRVSMDSVTFTAASSITADATARASMDVAYSRASMDTVYSSRASMDTAYPAQLNQGYLSGFGQAPVLSRQLSGFNDSSSSSGYLSGPLATVRSSSGSFASAYRTGSGGSSSNAGDIHTAAAAVAVGGFGSTASPWVDLYSARHQLNLNPNELPDPNALQRHVALMQQQARLQLAAQQQQQLQQYMQQQQLYRQQEQQQYMQQQQQQCVQAGQASSAHVDWGGYQGTLAELSDPAAALRLLQQQQQQQWK